MVSTSMSRKSPLPLSRSSRGILHAAGVPAATWTPAASVLKEEEATLQSERMVQQVVATAADGARRLVRLVVQVITFFYIPCDWILHTLNPIFNENYQVARSTERARFP